ncbi:hypothetical protein Dimus_031401, partial [Dionaea muscipula]
MDDGGRWLVVGRRRRVVAGERRCAMASSVVLDAVGRRLLLGGTASKQGRLELLLSVVIGDGNRGRMMVVGDGSRCGLLASMLGADGKGGVMMGFGDVDLGWASKRMGESDDDDGRRKKKKKLDDGVRKEA